MSYHLNASYFFSACRSKCLQIMFAWIVLFPFTWFLHADNAADLRSLSIQSFGPLWHLISLCNCYAYISRLITCLSLT